MADKRQHQYNTWGRRDENPESATEGGFRAPHSNGQQRDTSGVSWRNPSDVRAAMRRQEEDEKQQRSQCGGHSHGYHAHNHQPRGGAQAQSQKQDSMTIQLKFLTQQTKDCLKVVERYLQRVSNEAQNDRKWQQKGPSEELTDEKESVLTSLTLYRLKLRLMHKEMGEKAALQRPYAQGYKAALGIIAQFEKAVMGHSKQMSPRVAEILEKRCTPVLGYMRQAICKGDAPKLTTSTNYTFNAEVANGVMSQMMLHMNHTTPDKVKGWKRNEKQVEQEIRNEADVGEEVMDAAMEEAQKGVDMQMLYQDVSPHQREFAPSKEEQERVVEEGRRRFLRGCKPELLA